MVFRSGIRLQHTARRLTVSSRMPNGLEMSRPASSSILAGTRFGAAGRVGSIELLGSGKTATWRTGERLCGA
jgi:hypothetical protein